MVLKKKIISFLLIAMMVVANMPLMAFAEGDNIASGTCGTCSWAINSNGVLTISGGTLEDWGNGAPPWEPYGEYVYEVKIVGSVTALTCYSMFAGCEWAEHMDLTGLDTSGATNMGNMFYRCRSLNSLDVSGFNTANVTNMNRMFLTCGGLKSLDVSRFNTANVTNMGYMFSNCKSLTSLDLSGFDTANVTYMGLMFSGCESLTSVDVSGFNTANVTDMSYMFDDCKSLTSVDVSGFNTANVTDMADMFSGCESLTSLDVRAFNTKNVDCMLSMFEDCAALETLDLSSFNTSNTHLMHSMFDGCTSLKTLILGEFDLSKVVDEQYGNPSACFPVDMYDTETGELYEKGTEIPEVSQRTFIAVEGSGGDGQDTSEVHKSFTGSYDDEPRTFSGKKGFYYKDSYFNKIATKYNHSLATMSLCMAYSAYGIKEKNSNDYSSYDKNIKELMTKCGFASEDRYKEYHFNEKPTKDSIGCAIGYKRITIEGKTYPVIAVAVRGGGYEAEWADNFNVGSSGNHLGFDKSAELVKGYIIDYIKTHRLEGDIKIWITGFSRGGAVATQTAAKLDDLSGFAYPYSESDSGYIRVDFDKTSVYAYGFATPAGVVANSNPHSSAYSNIFSIIEYNDPVPLVAPEKWKCDRYGKTKIFIYNEGSNASNIYIDKVAQRLNAGKGYNVDNFENYVAVELQQFNPLTTVGAIKNPLNKDTQGTTLRKSVRALADIIGSRERYTNKYKEDITNGLAEAYGNNTNIFFTDAMKVILKKVPEMYILHPNLSATLIMNYATLAEPHADQEYYLAWMQLMDDNYAEDMDHLPLAWGNPNYRVFKANCPVDVYVYDEDNNVVASIVDEVPSDYENQEIIVSIDENGQKIAYLPVDGSYRVDVEAREDCEVTCGVEEYDAEFGESTRITNFETTSLESNETITADIDAFTDEELAAGASDGSDTSYVMTKDGENIEIISDLRGEEEITEHTYNVSTVYDDSQGAVYGGGSFAEGSYARLEAVANENYKFDGFYINGEKYEDSSSSEEPNIVRLKVTKDTEVEAKFIYSPEPDDPDDPDQPVHKHRFRGWEIVKPATEISTGIEVNSCMTCDLDETRTIPMLKPTLKAVKITKPKASKGAATIKWKKISKKNLKKIKKVEIQYSTDKNFTNDVKTKYAGAKKTSYKIKGLQKGKKYYVRIRAYTKAGGAVHVSKWSAQKPVKVK